MERLSWDGYAAAWAGLHGGFDVRAAAPAVRGWLRVPPTTITTFGLLLCLLVPPAAGRGGGWPFFAAALVALAAVADTVDGAIAVIACRATRMGSVYDSAADRIGEACWAGAFWVLGVPGPLAVACCAVGWLHEYVRVLAIGAGMTAIGPATVGQRPTRVLAALVGLLLAGAAGLVSADLAAGAVTVVATGWLLLGVFGLRRLFGAVRRSLT